MKHGLGLTTESGLLAIITPLSLSEHAILTLFVLGNLVESMLLAVLVAAVCLFRFGNVHLRGESWKAQSREL